MLDKVMSKWEEMAVVHAIPDGWQTDCDNCNWLLERYNRKDCFLFTSIFDGKFHVLNRKDAVEKTDEQDLSDST